MDQRVKEMWLKALRSGEYKQCRSQLSHSGGYCCLGVLEYLASQEGVVKFDGGRPYLSLGVAEWAGLGPANTNPKLGSESAGWLNDNRYDFNQIADLIEQNL